MAAHRGVECRRIDRHNARLIRAARAAAICCPAAEVHLLRVPPGTVDAAAGRSLIAAAASP